MTIAIRPAAGAEVSWMVDQAAAEGWNPGLRDAAAFRVADPAGFLLAVDGEEPVGCGSYVRYGEAFAFFGLFIVVPERRGQGVGAALFAAMLERGGERTIGLDGVLAQEPFYAGAGFVREHRSIRFRLDGRGDAAATPGSAATGGGDAAATPGSAATGLASVAFGALTAYDRRCFPARREAFLTAWTSMPGHVGRAVLREGVLRGYGVLRPCREGAKVGPLFANDPATAATLLDALLARVDGPVFLDVPDVRDDAAALAEERGGIAVFETVRMYRGRPPGFDRRKVFGITTLELG